MYDCAIKQRYFHIKHWSGQPQCANCIQKITRIRNAITRSWKKHKIGCETPCTPKCSVRYFICLAHIIKWKIFVHWGFQSFLTNYNMKWWWYTNNLDGDSITETRDYADILRINFSPTLIPLLRLMEDSSQKTKTSPFNQTMKYLTNMMTMQANLQSFWSLLLSLSLSFADFEWNVYLIIYKVNM